MPFKTSSTKVHPFVQEYLAALMNAGILLDNLSNIRCGQYELVRLEGWVGSTSFHWPSLVNWVLPRRVQLDIKQRTRLLKKLESIPSEYLMKYGTRWMDDMLQALELAQKTLDVSQSCLLSFKNLRTDYRRQSHASSEICTTAQFNGALTCLKTFLDQAPVVPAATVSRFDSESPHCQ